MPTSMVPCTCGFQSWWPDLGDYAHDPDCKRYKARQDYDHYCDMRDDEERYERRLEKLRESGL
jgi:hypothetical protein